MYKAFLRWIGYGFAVSVSFITICSAIFIFRTIKNPEQPPSIFGYRIMTVLSGSMSPTLETGDIVVMKDVSSNKITPGDVITYRVPHGIYVTHRVMGVDSEQGKKLFKTKGDANEAEDINLVPSEQVIGVMINKVIGGGYVVQVFRSPLGFILFIILPSLILLFLEGRNILYESRKNKRIPEK